ncbi:MAG TPA: S41 family peptidase [Thermoanaerobaculia bacterium]|nr:S41 family peptidase [Thermoanaerobaculia bacterium]
MRVKFLIAVLMLAASFASFAEEKAAIEPAAAEVLEKHVAAIGGRDAWAAVRNYRIVSESETFGITRKTTRIEEPATGRFHIATEAPDGKSELAFDGTNIWRKTAYHRAILPPDAPEALSAKRVRQYDLKTYRTHGLAYRRMPDETIDGKRYLVVTTTQKDEQDRDVPVRYVFDAETHLLFRTVRGAAVQQITTYSDYRKAGDVTVAFASTSETPQIKSANRVKEWVANVAFEPSIFAFGETAEQAAPKITKATVRPRFDLKPDDPVTEELRTAAFDAVWNKINDSYWDPTFGGKEWKAIGDTYRARLGSAKTSRQLHELLHEMTNQLGQTHFRVRGPENTVTLSSTGTGGRGSLGMRVRAVDGQIVVTDVEPDRAAAKAGIKKGFAVVKVNGKTVQELAAKMKEKEPALAARPDILLQRAAVEDFNGKAGEVVELDLLDHEDRPLHLSVARSEVPLSDMSKVEFESKRLGDGKIGYIRFDSFFGDVIAKTRAALDTMGDAHTVILDLRGNGGGAGDIAPSVAAMFASSKGTLGASRFRYSTREFSYEPAANAFTGKLIVLVDSGSASTSEVLTGALQETGRAMLIGTRTRGAVLPSLAEILPTGGLLQYVVSDFRTPKGVVLEGRGLYPDVEVKTSRADIIAGRDVVLERAVEEASRAAR